MARDPKSAIQIFLGRLNDRRQCQTRVNWPLGADSETSEIQTRSRVDTSRYTDGHSRKPRRVSDDSLEGLEVSSGESKDNGNYRVAWALRQLVQQFDAFNKPGAEDHGTSVCISSIMILTALKSGLGNFRG
ncbi:hypothetical protein N7519_008972 [Penicillium mononematosum]|uniref:uncharacterized protein n=1 Tax=Penicillium mononematosum TaxID=268346 RepID=UPI0025480048|nr:uncharacterized protein N7519_008972 [Penicillium mononematosum]KAJ6178511.1 hypothetical protein N7519_008972 [Penicillium mononematosum]